MPDEDPAITADAPEAEAPVVTPDAPIEEDPFAPVEGGEPQQFPREYVEKLRRSGAEYRTKAKEYESEIERLKPLETVFDGWEPEQVEGWQTFIQQAQENPDAALAALIQEGFALDREGASQLLDAIYAEAGDEQPGAALVEGDPDDDDRPMTVREYRAMQEAEGAKAEQAAALTSVKQEATELGYDPNADLGSLGGFKYQRLLSLAANVYANDLKQAHEALVAEEQALVKSHLDGLALEADSLPTPSGSGGPGAELAGAPDWKTTSERAREYIRAELQSQ